MPRAYPLADLNGLGPEARASLKAAGIRTSARLLEAAKDPKGRKTLSQKTGIDPGRLLEWANAADRMRVPGVGKEHASLLRAAGVDTIKDLKYRNPANLAKAMAAANAKRKLVRIAPSEKMVKGWIEHANKLNLKISYRNSRSGA
jgi:predicted RecB family nuclease